MGNKRSYVGAYRLEVVQMTRQPGKTVAGVAKELGIPWKTVSGWVYRWNKHGTQRLWNPGKALEWKRNHHQPLNNWSKRTSD